MSTGSSPYTTETIQTPSAGQLTCVIHTSYDPADPPALPGRSCDWTRFICISDTHTRTFDVPDGDVLLHAGDLTGTGRLKEMQTTVNWLIGMTHPVKV